MVFVGIYRAIYDYAPAAEGELAITEGDLLYVVDKSAEEDWWKAKKKAESDDAEEPEGLIPNNYVEEATPVHKAKALYDYTRQTDEELSFAEDTLLDVYDISDPDWTLVGLDGEYGFAPANYIEASQASSSSAAAAAAAAPVAPAVAPTPSPPPMPARPQMPQPEIELPPRQESPTPSSPELPVSSPAAALAGIIAQKSAQKPAQRSSPRVTIADNPVTIPTRSQYTPDDSDDDPIPSPPKLPQRPPSQQLSPPITQYATPRSPASDASFPSPAYDHSGSRDLDENQARSPVGFHLYNIHEMVSHMGKNKKMPMTLGINVPKGIIMISPEKSRDGPSKEWTADKLSHYSIEGKHVFIDLVKPSKSVDFHAGAKDTAEEIVSALGELAGAARAEGLREVLAAASGTSNVQRKGTILYDFMAQGEDEVTVGIGDEVLVLDDTKSEEWWMVRRLKNGKEGVVPSSYIEIIPGSTLPPGMSGLNAGISSVEQNRLEEQRITREASKASKRRSDDRSAEVGPSLQLPARNSSLMQSDNDTRRTSQRKPKDKGPSTTRTKPDSKKTRTWTDRTGSFKVEAEFIGLKDGKIHLHKLNGVKIAVPVPKMSIDDLEFVENITGVSLDEDKPLSDIRRKNTQRSKDDRPGLSLDQPKKSDYDWFDFFLQCGVNPQICGRYAAAFERDQMGEENLPDISEALLRTLGLKEGDILRVMKSLDGKYSRGKRNVSFGDTSVIQDGEDGQNGGLFSGPGGALKNNTRKGRPAPPVQTNDVVDPKAFEQKSDDTVKKPAPAEAPPASPAAALPPKKSSDGFDDNAWEVKPSKQPAQPAQPVATPASESSPTPAAASTPPATAPAAAPAPPPAPALTPSMQDLSLLSPPLQPTPAPQPTPPQQQPPPQAPQQIPQPTGASPSLFDQLANQPPAPQPPQGMFPQQTGFNQQQMTMPRQRPQPPQQLQTHASLIAPPPPRAASAPQNFTQQSAFSPPAPLQPQLTGIGMVPNMHSQIAPPGQSLQNLNQARMQQQSFGQSPLQYQQTGFQPQNAGFGQMSNGLMPQPTGFPMQQPMQTGFGGFSPQQQQPGFQPMQQVGSPFADPPMPPFQPMMQQPTGIPGNFGQPASLQPQATGINAFLPPALQPQRTGLSPLSANNFGQVAPPVPPIPQHQTLAPLQPQKTGPAPPVRFGVTPAAQKLTPQPTGKKANLAHATPQNPFGF